MANDVHVAHLQAYLKALIKKIRNKNILVNLPELFQASEEVFPSVTGFSLIHVFA
jgi:hypothetical protein